MIQWLESIDRSRLAVGGLGLAVVLFFAVNVFSNATFEAARLDMTEGKLFTLSEGTRNVLADIDEPITVRLYFTKLLGERSPRHATYFERIRELLERYSDLARGKVRLELLNPEPFSDAEDQAVAAGLQGVPLNNAGDLGYFGLAAANATDDRATIPFFSPDRETFLEYDLTKVVYTLAKPKRKVVGLMTRLPIDGGGMRPPFTPSPPWAVMDQMNEFFEVRALPLDLREIPDDIDILMIVHPRGFNDFTLYAIDQFVLGGGRALVFVDAHAEVAAQGARGVPGGTRSEFDRLLGAWGVKLADKQVAGDLDSARRVNFRVGGKLTAVDYVAWLTLHRDNFDTEDVVTGDLTALNVATAGILEKAEGADTEFRPLVTTGPRSMGIDAAKFAYQPDVVALFREFKAGDKPLTLAARISGTLKTAFPDGPPKDKAAPKDKAQGGDGAAPGAEHIAEAAKPANVIVVADVDMLHDQFWVDTQNLLGRRIQVPFANNADFVINSLDNLAGSDALISLRGRAKSSRPFHLVQDIRQAAERQFRAKEKELQAKLDDLRAKLDRLERRRGAKGEVVISQEDKAAIDNFRNEMIVVRKELRHVQRALRIDIERLDTWMKFLNIAAIPLLLGIGTIIVTVVSRFRRRGRRRAVAV